MKLEPGCTRGIPAAPPLVFVVGEAAKLLSLTAFPADAPLASLEASLLTCRYHAWWGLSGVRYTTSIFSVDHGAEDVGLPSFDGFVFMSIARSGGALRLVDAAAIETGADRSVAIASGIARGASEWHVHLLAEGPWRRRAAVDDLLARHRPEVMAALSA